MKKKIIGIFVMTLLIATALPAVGTMNAVEDKKIFPTHLTGVEWSRIYHHESELFDDCNIQHVETLSQFYNCVTYDDLDTFIIDAMDEYHIPGLSASIVRNGSFLLTRSYGYANITQSVYVQDTTLFMLASISKTITATATMQLYEQGFLI